MTSLCLAKSCHIAPPGSKQRFANLPLLGIGFGCILACLAMMYLILFLKGDSWTSWPSLPVCLCQLTKNKATLRLVGSCFLLSAQGVLAAVRWFGVARFCAVWVVFVFCFFALFCWPLCGASFLVNRINLAGASCGYNRVCSGGTVLVTAVRACARLPCTQKSR